MAPARAARPERERKRVSRLLLLWLAAGYAFLYAPIAYLVVFSFNASRMVTAWDGASLRWYQELATDPTLVDAALLSLRIAAASASIFSMRYFTRSPIETMPMTRPSSTTGR